MTALATPEQTSRRGVARRTTAIDGLRGIAIGLVVLFHAHVVWPAGARRTLGSFDAIFQAGNVAVSAFFVISGFLVTDRLLTSASRHRVWGPLVYLEQRTVRIALQVYVLLLAVLVMSRVDPTDTTPDEATTRSLVAAATFSFNTYVRDHALAARSDIGPLYFLSIDVQYFAAATVVIIVLARWRQVLMWVAVLALVVTFWWRWQVYLDQGWYRAALTTTSRMDGLLAGSAAAAALHGRPAPPWLTRNATALAGASAGLLIGVVVSCAFVQIDGYFGVQGIVATLATTLLVMALRHGAADTGYTTQAFSWRPFGILGRASLTVFLWHMPVFQLVRRHFGEWHSVPRTLVALGILVVVAVVVESVVVPVVEALIRRVFGWRRIARLTSR